MAIPQGSYGPSRNRPSSGSKRLGVTLVAAILSLLLLLLLVALVASAVWTARGAAKRAACTRNLEKLVSALQTYAQVNGGLPPAVYEIERTDDTDAQRVTWRELVETYVGDPRCFVCPADESACAAEKSRPPESRAATFPCSYEYVWQQPVRESEAERAGGHRSTSHTSARRSQADTPVLVCRHHDTPEAGRVGWCLVAYEDGSIRWERRRPAQIQESFEPLSRDGESPQRSVGESGPERPAKRRSPDAVSGPASRSDATPASQLSPGRERRSR